MEYSQAQEDYRDKTKVMMQRQLQITTGKRVNESDVDEMLEKGNIKVFTQDVCTHHTMPPCSLLLLLQILVNTAQQRQALNEVEQRHREIVALEQDIKVYYL